MGGNIGAGREHRAVGGAGWPKPLLSVSVLRSSRNPAATPARKDPQKTGGLLALAAELRRSV